MLDYFNQIKLRKGKTKTTIIAGSLDFIDRIKADIKNKNVSTKILSLKENNMVSKDDPKNYIGKLYQLPDLISIYNVNEVIFSSKDITYKDMITEMALSKNKYVDYKISLNPNLIIGSQNIENYN